ncbi:uncharacterized protein LOC121429187 [Lytechinus variegatus]|uniref:uncharacterized protein LOC121429187 n=1 Tax=Lytechinus variegatus TaxID=7654 RepID=UPI001BB10203|nr:uncharacterized protein LOC121429187 [Lytechinus variegatus]XP_041482066.1 uncharacterized protein LOC121429187 [Lytechinus variegatus]
MDKPDIKLSAVFGVSIFGILSVISAIGLVTVGVYAIMEEGIVLGIKTPLWVGGAVFIGGILTIGIAICGKISYLKSLILLVITVTSFLLCSASLLLLEFAEKSSIFQLSSKQVDNGAITRQTLWRSPYVIYLIYLICSVVGMVTAVVGFLYVYCILIAPVRNQQWKSYQTQIQTQTRNRDQVQDQYTRTKYTFKNKPSPKEHEGKVKSHKGKMKSKENKNKLPESSWIYDSQSIHSLTATPTRAFPKNRETQLKKDVVEELQHNSTFKVHRYQTRSSPSPVPPPLPPIQSSALGLGPTPPKQVKETVPVEQHPSTAKSLEHYPIPRKYSLRRSSKRGSNRGRQHPGTYRLTSPGGQRKDNTEGGGNFIMEHHPLPDVLQENLGDVNEHGFIGEQHSTFHIVASAKGHTDQPFGSSVNEATPLQTSHQDMTSGQIVLKPVPVKRKCNRQSSPHRQCAPHPSYDQVRPNPINPNQDANHCVDLDGLPLVPIQHQENRMPHQKPVRHFGSEIGDTNIGQNIEAVQSGGTDTEDYHLLAHQQREVSADRKTHPGLPIEEKIHPIPNQRSAYAIGIHVKSTYHERVWDTEGPQVTQHQIHQLYQPSRSDNSRSDPQEQLNLNQQGRVNTQAPSIEDNPSTGTCDQSIIKSIQRLPNKPVASPRLSLKRKLQRQSNVAEVPVVQPPVVYQRSNIVKAPEVLPQLVHGRSNVVAAEVPSPVIHRRSTRRKVHEHIQAMQQMLWMEASDIDGSDLGIDRSSPPDPQDEVDHLQPRLAVTKGKVDNLQDLQITSTRL